MRRQSGIAGSGLCLGGLGLSPVSFGSSFFWASVSPSIKWVVVGREVVLIALKLVVISLILCSLLPPSIVKVLSGTPWLWEYAMKFQAVTSFPLTSQCCRPLCVCFLFSLVVVFIFWLHHSGYGILVP